MATTVTKIEESLLPEAGGPGIVEGAGSAREAYPSDDEILGIGDAAREGSSPSGSGNSQAAADAGRAKNSDNPEDAESSEGAEKRDETEKAEGTAGKEGSAIPKEFEAIFATPGAGAKLREIYQRDAEYREIFPSVNDALEALEARQELARVDELFDSGDPAAHVELIAGLAQRDPQAFRSLAATFGERLAEIDPEAYRVISAEFARTALDAGGLPEQLEMLARAAEKGDAAAVKFLAGEVAGKLEGLRKGGAREGALRTQVKEGSLARKTGLGMTAARPGPAGKISGASGTAAAGKFIERVNDDVERGVEQAVGGRVAELLPDAPERTRQKLSSEIYRELDAALKKDTALLQQVSANFTATQKSGQFGEKQRAAMAAMVMGKAKALLPAVAKRVVGDWTAAVVGANQARRAKQSAAASRADVGVGGAPRPVSTQAARVDYRKMSDEEILDAE
jgi:hypothetical protein